MNEIEGTRRDRILVGNESDETHRDEEQTRAECPATIVDFLYLVLEADRPRAGGARFSLLGVDEVIISRGQERKATRQRVGGVSRLIVCVPGRSLSSVHARLRRGSTEWLLEDAGSTNGSYVNGSRIERAIVGAADVLEMGHAFFTIVPSAATDVDSDLDSCALSALPRALVTLRPELKRELDNLCRVARSKLPLTLVGESGTGKEVIAKAVHVLSERAGPFIALNCAALTESIAESQLFGHVRGAFSGAVADATGFVRSAHTGTFLLDEVKELSQPTQAALLRVLQEGEVVAVGAARPQSVDVRYVATSPYPLDRAVQQGRFRPDLFARLSGYVHRLPPLRERREDIGSLIALLLQNIDPMASKQIPIAREFALRLLLHSWPLNIRELELVLTRAYVLAKESIDLADLSAVDVEVVATRGIGGAPSTILSPEDQQLRRHLIDELSRAKGNVAQVARSFGRAPMQVHRWMKRFALDPAAFRLMGAEREKNQ